MSINRAEFFQCKKINHANQPSNSLDTQLPPFARRSIHFLSSSAFMNVCFTTIKNLPYTLASHKLGLNTVTNALCSRIAYIESGAMSFGSLVVNTTAAIFFTVLTAFSFGLNQSVRHECQKFWIHTTLSTAAVAVSVVGVASPSLALAANLGLAGVLTYTTVKAAEEDLVGLIKNLYFKNRPNIEAFAKVLVNQDEKKFQLQFKPSLDLLDVKMPKAKKFSDLTDMIRELKVKMSARLLQIA